MGTRDSVIAILRRLDLTSPERELVASFAADAKSRLFLHVADMLRSRGYLNESIELLSEGLSHWPNFAVARVVLARELWVRGDRQEAEEVLLDTPTDLTSNVVAQKILAKAAIHRRDWAAAEERLAGLSTIGHLDPEIEDLRGKVLEGAASDREQLGAVMAQAPNRTMENDYSSPLSPAVGGFRVRSLAHAGMDFAPRPQQSDGRPQAHQERSARVELLKRMLRNLERHTSHAA